MAKPSARRVPSDDYEVEADGITYRPHEGEWVEVMPGITVGERMAYVGLARLGVTIQAAAGERDEYARLTEAAERYYEMVCASLARRVVAWNWTDQFGVPLPPPRDNPDVFRLIDETELNYLAAITRGETVTERKNALPPSPITSSATRSPATAA